MFFGSVAEKDGEICFCVVILQADKIIFYLKIDFICVIDSKGPDHLGHMTGDLGRFLCST
jgi:hypothetical protein